MKSRTATAAELKAVDAELDRYFNLEPVTWNQEISQERARIVLTSECFDMAVARGEWHCEGRALGWWYANDPAYYQAYKTAARVARALAGK